MKYRTFARSTENRLTVTNGWINEAAEHAFLDAEEEAEITKT
jgi:hypothetical protein